MKPAKDTISQKQWVKFAKGHAKANETRTGQQVIGDQERLKNWKSN